MMNDDARLRVGIPKGSLQETTKKLFALSGFNLRISGRSYYPDIDDPDIQCILIRPQEMARYVEQGVLTALSPDWTGCWRLVLMWPNWLISRRLGPTMAPCVG